MRSWTRLVGLGAAAALVALGAACAQRAEQNPLTAGLIAPGGRGGPNPADDPDAVVEAALADVGEYWARTYPEVYGGEFAPISGGFYAYGPDTGMPPCGDPPPAYAEIADNAFYCPSDDLIAWDRTRLIPDINQQFGGFTIGIVFAHEYAHAVQVRAGVTGRTIDLELQADCFAGAWTADVAAGNSERFSIDEGTLDASVGGIVAISDIPGTREDDPMAHGSGFDRIGAFQDGFENGPRRCAERGERRARTVEIPFEEGETASGGNMALEDGPAAPDGVGLLSRIETDLNDFYGLLFDELGQSWTPVEDLVLADPDTDEVSCGGDTLSGDDLRNAARYCEDENVVVVDGAGLVPELYRIGDFAVAAEIARLWALAAQTELGLDTEGEAASLQADCLTGVWAFARFPGSGVPPSQLEMSPGDLDEGIMGFLAYDLADEGGTVFERTDALRTGFLEGYRGCEQYGPL
ncbi:MAG TPA: neutral zinc metallopeptidase [Acidimicrobiales bacterium]